jgi:SAM-dependent methyltransferase
LAEHSRSDQSEHWSRAAQRYEEEFIDPEQPGGRNPLRPILAGLARQGRTSVADLGCGTGPLLPFLAEHFRDVIAVDFAEGMLARARQRCQDLRNVRLVRSALRDVAGRVDAVEVAVAVNSLIMPDLDELEASLAAIHRLLRPGGTFLGIVPAMDSVHYHTMLLVDRARRTGMPQPAARKNAALHAEHELFDFAFSEFRYRGLVQHFWQPFEVPYRLRRAGFRRVRMRKVLLSWDQVSRGNDLADHPPLWDWFFQADKSVTRG